MKKSCVNNIIPFSAVDGVGNRMIVFFKAVILTAFIVIIQRLFLFTL